MSDRPGLRLVAVAADRPGTVTLDGRTQPTITAALAVAVRGSVVSVGRGRYTGASETFPLRVPAGVTLTGPVPPPISEEARRFLPTPPPAEIVASSCAIEVAGDDARVAHLKIRNSRPGMAPAVRIAGVGDSVLDTCQVHGEVEIDRADAVAVTWSTVEHGRIVARQVTGLRITGGKLVGTHGAEALIEVVRSDGVRVEAAALVDAGHGVSATACTDVFVAGCAVLADHDAVHVADSRLVTVSGNRLRGERAVNLEDCDGVAITANGIEQADTAIALHACSGVDIGFNHIARAVVEVARTGD